MAKILLVDDEVTQTFVLQQALLMNGHDVHTAQNGAHALKHLDAVPFDVVISDLYMPVMNGYELLTAMRKHASHMDTPFILLTGSRDDYHHFVDQHHHIADAVLDKPYVLRTLNATIDWMVENR
jgi:DNA-binding response OmpR family regulator